LGIEAYTELRTHVALTKFRIPDVLVVRKGLKFEHILDQPPLIAIEILSPADQWNDVLEKVEEYRLFQVENIWIFDPKHRAVWLAGGGRVCETTDGALTLPGTPIHIEINEVFAELDRV
jgi:Uma2 family endonuclease